MSWELSIECIILYRISKYLQYFQLHFREERSLELYYQCQSILQSMLKTNEMSRMNIFFRETLIKSMYFKNPIWIFFKINLL